MKAKWKLKLKTDDRRSVTMFLRYDTGLVHIDAWDGEQTVYMSYMTMQNGRTDLGVMDIQIDSPISCKVYSEKTASFKSYDLTKVLEKLVERAIADLFKYEETPASPKLSTRSAALLKKRIVKLFEEE